MSKTRWTITSDKFLNPDQIKLLISYITNKRDLAIARGNDVQAIKDYYIVRGLLESGCRVKEFCDLQNRDFNGLKLSVRCGKGGKPRTILLTRATGNLFNEWLRIKEKLTFDKSPDGALFPSRYGDHYSTRGVQDRIKIIFKASGLPEHLSVHCLRHTYCSLLLASKKVDLATVRDNLGHHSISVTNLYSHVLGNIDDVELYPKSTVENTENCEVETLSKAKKRNNSVKSFLRKVNFK